MTGSEGAPTGRPSRRAVLQGVGVTVVAGAAGYAGFRAYDPDPGTASAYDPAPADQGGAALARLSDIPAGGGLVLRDAQLVLTRPDDGSVRCFSAVCTHQGCLVTGVRDGEISCSCHGSAFDAATGAVVQGPATSPLAEIAVEVTGGSVVRQ